MENQEQGKKTSYKNILIAISIGFFTTGIGLLQGQMIVGIIFISISVIISFYLLRKVIIEVIKKIWVIIKKCRLKCVAIGIPIIYIFTYVFGLFFACPSIDVPEYDIYVGRDTTAGEVTIIVKDKSRYGRFLEYLYPAFLIPVPMPLKINPRKGQIQLSTSDDSVQKSNPIVKKWPGSVVKMRYFFESGSNFGDVQISAFKIFDNVERNIGRDNKNVRFVKTP